MLDSIKHRKATIRLGILGMIICAILLILPVFDICKYKNAFSYFGSFASFWGIVLALIQIVGLLDSNEAISTEVAKNRQEISKILSVSDITKHAQMIDEVHQYVIDAKWELAKLRMSDIQIIISEINLNKDKYQNGEEARKHLTSIKEDMIDINQAILDSSSISKSTIANHLDEIKLFLTTSCSQLKSI